MKELYSKYCDDDLWLIKETEFVRKLQGIRETQFAQGNGYIGTRGIYEEIPYDCSPGTYVAGIYDKLGAQVSEIVNLPNPVNFKFTVEGEKISVIAMDIASHKRVLNTKKGLLIRHTLYHDRKKQRYDYQSLRFISSANKNIGVMQIALTPLDAGCTLDVSTGISTSVSNAGILSEGRKRHFRVKELGQGDDFGYIVADTFEKKFTIVSVAGFYYSLNGKKIIAQDNIFRLKLKKNQTVVFTKVFCIKHYTYKKDSSADRKNACAIFKKAFKKSFSGLITDHVNAWDLLWKRADIVVEGTSNLQQNLRFNIYHMLICGHYDEGFSSIGARTLSGEGYRGHVFWDTEIFIFPFFLFTFPDIAKNMLLYRYKRLQESRNIAKKNGYKGAQFAWESADLGCEETPTWARDLDRTLIKIHTHQMEHHIVADIAYAVHRYYIATGDHKFMDDYGYEILIETARFWASRVTYNKRKEVYDINNVIGPDEFHIGVNNNVFTNMMAKWNLSCAYRMCTELRQKKVFSLLQKKLKLHDKEIKTWKTISSKISCVINKDKIIEQFDGYFKLKKIILTKTDENGIPFIPIRLKSKDLGKTQLVKQADVLMLLCLLGDNFSRSTKKANYDYYIGRTAHKSSLSAPMHALCASGAGDLQKAYMFFNVGLRADISNLYGNTLEGAHAASLGGTWQALVFGFAGIEIRKEDLCIDPHMPYSWQRLIFNLSWKGAALHLELTNEAIKIRVSSKKIKNFKIGIWGKPQVLSANKNYVFKKSISELKKQRYY
jgi:kojibiose phosphorylase